MELMWLCCSMWLWWLSRRASAARCRERSCSMLVWTCSMLSCSWELVDVWLEPSDAATAALSVVWLSNVVTPLCKFVRTATNALRLRC
eukprot:6461224-Amphidinium_carterae.3